MSIFEESVWFLTLGLFLFFGLLGIFSLKPMIEKEDLVELGTSNPISNPSSQPKVSLLHLMVLGAIIMAIQFGQYTCDKQMKTEKERIVLSP